MERMLDMYRAARLAGVKPAELERRVAEGQYKVENGQIYVHDLLVMYPEVELKKTGMVEVVSQIKDDAILKVVANRNPANSPAALILENTGLRKELVYYRRQVQRQKDCINDLRGMLVSMRDRFERPQAIHIENILVWLRQKMKENKQG